MLDGNFPQAVLLMVALRKERLMDDTAIILPTAPAWQAEN
jgi:hypothetical protein